MLLVFVSLSAAAAAPIVTTSTGAVEGKIEDGVAGFFGIPFAASPTGDLRFAAPQPHAPWPTVRKATMGGAACTQGSGPPGPHPPSPCGSYCSDHSYKPDECGCGICGSFGGCSFSCTADPAENRYKCPTTTKVEVNKNSEDCLFLNVFTPASALEENAPLAPVMFYIHGGGFVAGSAPAAWNLTRATGHVVIAIQYRLGVLGFYSGSDPAAPVNFGMLDQRLAMQWAQANAEAFGGDPKKVLIFGCSAGGASVAGHLIDPQSDGLYIAAGIESPGGHQGWMGDEKRSDDDWMSAKLNLANSNALAVQMNCTSAADLACMRAVDLGTLYHAAVKVRFAPALANETYPLGLIHAGKWNMVPTIIGGQSCESCKDAQGKFGPPQHPDTVTTAELTAALIAEGFSGVEGSGVGPTELLTWYKERIAKEGNWRTFARILSDSGHACSSALHAQALAAHAPSGTIWRYFFGYVAPKAGGGQLPGATHGGDETWIFRTAGKTAGEIQLSSDMASWWASLATSGDPNSDAVAGAVRWTPYTSASDAAMFLGVVDDPTPRLNSTADTVRAECSHWEKFMGY